MAFDPFSAGFDLIKVVIDKIWPDANISAEQAAEKAKALLAAQQFQASADYDLYKQQALTNIEEAKSPNWFVAGWRPAIGWICGYGFGWQYALQPTLDWLFRAVGHAVPAGPTFDTGTLITLLFGLLGIGGLRTVEKIKGVSR